MIVKLFLTDIDGVWTDGGMYYGEAGDELKKFNTSDSVGVLFLKLLNIPTIIVTGENSKLVQRRANKLKIEDCFLGVDDKVSVANKISKKYNIALHEMAYIGDDINDINLLKLVGLSATPHNAPKYIKDIVDWPLETSGGEGAYRAFVDRYLEENKMLEKVLDMYLSQSRKLMQ